MIYHIIDMVDTDLTNTKLKELVNKKLYHIIKTKGSVKRRIYEYLYFWRYLLWRSKSF